MRLLAFDTATSQCSAAVWADGAVAARETEPMRRGHAEALMPMIQRVLAAAESRYADLDAVAATVGPGAFTGLRVGLATARGLVLAAGIPGIGITSLEAVAANDPTDGPRLVALDARRRDLYVQAFAADGTPLTDAAACLPADLPAHVAGLDGPWTVAGDAAETAAGALGAPVADTPGVPDAGVVAALAAHRDPAGHPLEPLYLRPPDATPPADGGRVRPAAS